MYRLKSRVKESVHERRPQGQTRIHMKGVKGKKRSEIRGAKRRHVFFMLSRAHSKPSGELFMNE